MARLAAIYRALMQVRNPAVDQALAAALPTARGGALRGIVQAVLERGDAAGELGLVEQFHRLPHETQTLVTDHAGQLFRAIREAAGSRKHQSASNAVELVRRSGSTRLAYLMIEQLRHGSPDQKAAAATCLLELTRRPVDGTGAQFLMSAIYEAVAAFGQHQQPAVLLATAELVPRGLREAPRLLGDSLHPAYKPWQAILRRADEPAVRRTLLLMLARSGLAEAAGEGLRKAVASTAIHDVLTSSHYLALPSVARGLAGLKTPGGLMGAPNIGGDAGRGLPALLAAWPAERADRITQLARLHTHPEAPIRIAALRSLLRFATRTPDAALTEAVAAFRHDPDAAIARAAVTHLVHTAGSQLSRLLADLVSCPHESVRRIAAQRLAPRSFNKLWESWPKLDPAKRLAAGRALIKLDTHFHRMLGEKLAVAEGNLRLRALGMISDLGQGAFFEPALVRLATSPDGRVASSAVRALASGSNDDGHATLEASLSHPDPRVRANAVEALAAREPARHIARFVDMTADDASRPRANAIAALLTLDPGAGVEALRQMLADPRPTHRVSGLWLVQTAGVIELAGHVAELAVSDPDRDVQRRARAAVRRLIHLLTPPAAPDAGDIPQPINAPQGSEALAA